MIRAVFDNGTLIWSGDEIAQLAANVPELFKFDSRINGFRSRACDYALIRHQIRNTGLLLEDNACGFAPLEDLSLQKTLIPRDHQQKAFEAWRSSNYRGVVSMPTGSGKTILAVMAIARLRRPTLVLVPTIDLMIQWTEVLESFFKLKVGMWGGGSNETCDITVSTYNSAVLKMLISLSPISGT